MYYTLGAPHLVSFTYDVIFLTFAEQKPYHKIITQQKNANLQYYVNYSKPVCFLHDTYIQLWKSLVQKKVK